MKMLYQNFSLIFGHICFLFLDPDSDPDAESGTTDPIESASGSKNTDKSIIQNQRPKVSAGVRSHAPSIQSSSQWESQKNRFAFISFSKILFNHPAESIATFPSFGPIEGQKWFDQISSQWEP